MDQLLLEFYSHLVENTKDTYIMKVSGQDPSSKSSLEMVQMRGTYLVRARVQRCGQSLGEQGSKGQGARH